MSAVTNTSPSYPSHRDEVVLSGQDNEWRRRAADFFHNVDFFHSEGESSEFSLCSSQGGHHEPRQTQLTRQESPTGVVDQFPFVDPFEAQAPADKMQIEAPPQPKLIPQCSLSFEPFSDDPLAAPPLPSTSAVASELPSPTPAPTPPPTLLQKK